jgi:hypothetical protein
VAERDVWEIYLPNPMQIAVSVGRRGAACMAVYSGQVYPVWQRVGNSIEERRSKHTLCSDIADVRQISIRHENLTVESETVVV